MWRGDREGWALSDRDLAYASGRAIAEERARLVAQLAKLAERSAPLCRCLFGHSEDHLADPERELAGCAGAADVELLENLLPNEGPLLELGREPATGCRRFCCSHKNAVKQEYCRYATHEIRAKRRSLSLSVASPSLQD